MNDRKATWTKVTFGQIAECVTDRVDDPSMAGVDRYVGLDHLDPDTLTIRRWGTPSDVASTKLRFRPGDIIFGKRRAYQRKLAVADFEGICSAHAMVLRAKAEAVLPEFLPFFMQSDLFMQRAVSISVGSLSPTINWKTLAAEEFALPPLEEQRRVADALMAIESGIRAQADLIAASDLAYDSYSSVWFRGDVTASTAAHPRLGRVTTDWPIVTIGDLTRLSQYGLSTAPQEVGTHPILRMMNLVNGQAVENDIRFVELSSEEFETYRLEPNDILFNRTNSIDLVGRTGIYGLDGTHVFASYLVRLKLDTDRVRPEYVVEFLSAPLGRQQVLSYATKAVSQANVSASNLAKVLIPLPPLDIQDRILGDLRMLRAAKFNADDRLQRLRSMASLVRTSFQMPEGR
jgi:type I restriction enzyme S subunit